MHTKLVDGNVLKVKLPLKAGPLAHASFSCFPIEKALVLVLVSIHPRGVENNEPSPQLEIGLAKRQVNIVRLKSFAVGSVSRG